MASSIEVTKLCKYILDLNISVIPQNYAKQHAENAKIGSYFIVNTAPSYIQKGHYVCFVKWAKKELVLFDPLGSYLTIQCFSELIHDYKTIYFLDHPIQHPQSEFCSLFVIGFLKSYQNNNIKNFLNKFNKIQIIKNDEIIFNFLKDCLNNQKLKPSRDDAE